ncbi:MAG: PadR family transcriptional regulator [Chloroflexota bacterium]|nr:PadR family transcriptional regulator [Chloroflexota bacterium]
MDERALLLLGILRMQSLHGYRLMDFIERNLSRVTNMKKATAYALLERLREAGYVRIHTEQQGNRPLRQVYTITPEGEKQFQTMLRENLSHADRTTFAGDIGLMFFDQLPREEAVQLLKHRLDEVNADIAVYEQTPEHGLHTKGVTVAIEHLLVVLRANRDWLITLIHHLEEDE